MTEDAIYQEGGQQQQDQGFSSPSSIEQPSAAGHDDSSGSDNIIAYGIQNDGTLTLRKEQLPAYEDMVFSLITNNNGKLRFVDLLEIVGGPPHKNILYKALASLARQGRIERIRGIGKKRIEFFYHDKKKLKRPPPSAAVSFVSR